MYVCGVYVDVDNASISRFSLHYYCFASNLPSVHNPNCTFSKIFNGTENGLKIQLPQMLAFHLEVDIKFLACCHSILLYNTISLSHSMFGL